jgi:ribosomal protein L11 methylase PrmA
MTNDSASVPAFVHTFADILAPFVPTPPDVVERMLELADIGGDDFLFDLGCGDGRIPITAAQKYGARAFGVDSEPYRVTESQANANAAHVDHLVTFRLQDAATVDLSAATVITLYLVHWSTNRMKSKILAEAKPGTRIVSHGFEMTDWEPWSCEEFVDSDGETHKLYLWVVE